MSVSNEMFRTNFFKVRNISEFKNFINWLATESSITIDVWEKKNVKGELLVGIGSYNAVPLSVYDEILEEVVPFDLMEEIASRLEKGWVAVLIYGGNNGLSELFAGVVGINHKWERKEVTLDNLSAQMISLGEFCTSTSF